MRRLLVLAGFAAAWVLAGDALAAGNREKPKQEEAIGKFVSATLAADVIQWKLAMEADGVEKTFEMAADVSINYTEKNGQKHASSIAPTVKKAPEAKGKRLVASGKFVSAALQGQDVAVTIKVAEHDQVFLLLQRLEVRYTQQAGKLVASRLSPAPMPERVLTPVTPPRAVPRIAE
jgi:hypothetical protein